MIEGPELARDTALKHVDAMYDEGYNVALLVFVNAAGEVIQTALNGASLSSPPVDGIVEGVGDAGQLGTILPRELWKRAIRTIVPGAP